MCYNGLPGKGSGPRPGQKIRQGAKKMNNKIKVFENAEFGSVRTVTINGEPWFVGKDVAIISEY